MAPKLSACGRDKNVRKVHSVKAHKNECDNAVGANSARRLVTTVQSI